MASISNLFLTKVEHRAFVRMQSPRAKKEEAVVGGGADTQCMANNFFWFFKGNWTRKSYLPLFILIMEPSNNDAFYRSPRLPGDKHWGVLILFLRIEKEVWHCWYHPNCELMSQHFHRTGMNQLRTSITTSVLEVRVNFGFWCRGWAFRGLTRKMMQHRLWSHSFSFSFRINLQIWNSFRLTLSKDWRDSKT